MKALRALPYRVGEFGWGPKSEILPGQTAAAARIASTILWWVIVWPTNGFKSVGTWGK